jgi:hypothetical protein
MDTKTGHKTKLYGKVVEMHNKRIDAIAKLIKMAAWIPTRTGYKRN